MSGADSTIRSDPGIEDPFDVAFPVALDAAGQCCVDRQDPDGPCISYHLLWPRLRRIGCTGSAWIHAENYVSTFRRLAASGHRRVLVSGTADYTMTAFLIHAYAAEGVEPEITVLDRCGAPLVVNRWYAERHVCSIRTLVADLLDFEDDLGFDVITTDNFLARFNEVDRGRVFNKWRELMRPGGIVVTAQRIDGESALDGDRSNGDKVARKLHRIRIHATQKAYRLDISVDQLLLDAKRYYMNRLHFPLRSIAGMTRQLEECGFEVQATHKAPPHVPDCPRTGGLSRLSRHTCFVARVCESQHTDEPPNSDPELSDGR